MITGMEKWEREYRDLVVPAFIEIWPNRQGEFQFGTVHGWMDCRFGMRDGWPAVEFSWDGEDDNDPGSGRGWATLGDGRLRGRVFIHCGEDSAFEARRSSAKRPTRARRA